MAVRHLDVARQPSSGANSMNRLAVPAFILVIAAGGAPGFHRDRQARLGNKLFWGLVQAHQRPLGIMGPRVDGKHVFHRRYEAAVGIRRDDPALPAMGLEAVFFERAPDRWVVRAADSGFAPEELMAWCEANGVQDAEFGFCEIEPAAVLGRVMPFERSTSRLASAAGKAS
jgi:hypothetical protein